MAQSEGGGKLEEARGGTKRSHYRVGGPNNLAMSTERITITETQRLPPLISQNSAAIEALPDNVVKRTFLNRNRISHDVTFK
ncbi:hypothetical protein AMTR_s00011p00227190 [Amborella trichopoda]|uniref:Uncharacterized protein n=1 Tax=Amborella trichopoda TaxID=13333 RepID=W1NHM2_AMBTC|nr:hypothetical protein AMTR_s00011p00227190 [Amborella trichopoda]